MRLLSVKPQKCCRHHASLCDLPGKSRPRRSHRDAKTERLRSVASNNAVLPASPQVGLDQRKQTHKQREFGNHWLWQVAPDRASLMAEAIHHMSRREDRATKLREPREVAKHSSKLVRRELGPRKQEVGNGAVYAREFSTRRRGETSVVKIDANASSGIHPVNVLAAVPLDSDVLNSTVKAPNCSPAGCFAAARENHDVVRRKCERNTMPRWQEVVRKHVPLVKPSKTTRVQQRALCNEAAP
jgi:hypothetical protein